MFLIDLMPLDLPYLEAIDVSPLLKLGVTMACGHAQAERLTGIKDGKRFDK
jgi:hypothetical protein